LVALLGCGAVACAEESTRSFKPTLKWGECPADVEVTFLSRHQCGVLTVPEDRNKSNGHTVELLVVKVWPVGVEPRPGIVTGLGGNIGDPRQLTGNSATGATRLGAISVDMEIRGAGPHATPSLRCPETDQLAARAASSVTDDETVNVAFVAAVGACAHRLRTSGIDPAAYDVSAIAADIDDLRQALGIDRWLLLGTQGTMSRATFEYLRAYPDRADGAFLDSPWFPNVDDLAGGIAGTRTALTELFAACKADDACNTTYPDLEQTWQRALDRLRDTPLTGTFDTASATIHVVIDAPKLLRAARFALGGDGPANAGLLPATIAAAAHGKATPWLVATVAQDPIFCAGYRPFCVGQAGFSIGVYLTAFCRDQAPYINDNALKAAADGDPIYEAVFVDSPYRSACKAWDVPPAGPGVAQPVGTNVPLLMLPGQLDSFSPPALAETEASRLHKAWSIEVPGQTHNTLGFADCAVNARNHWAQAPTRPPDPDACRSAPPLAFATEPP
jgi:pimeloyl-ACP methyl ester carboxylesterase